MNERNLIAAVLASGLAPALREKGQSFQMAAEKAVELYECMLAELAKANLPPSQSRSAEPPPVRTAPVSSASDRIPVSAPQAADSAPRAPDSAQKALGELETTLSWR